MRSVVVYYYTKSLQAFEIVDDPEEKDSYSIRLWNIIFLIGILFYKTQTNRMTELMDNFLSCVPIFMIGMIVIYFPDDIE